MYSIEFERAALKTLRAMPKNVSRLLLVKIEALAANPAQAQNVKRLVGRPAYRLRVGDWRVIYTLVEERLIVRVLEIGARGGVYQ